MQKPFLAFLALLPASFLFAQSQGGFEFLNLPVGAKAAGLGGVIASASGNGVNLFLSNPSLLDTAHHNHLSWSHLSFYGGVKYNTLAYARAFKKPGIFAIGIQHLGYGDINSYTPSGNPAGTFSANDLAVTLSHSRQLGAFRLGANLKYIQANLYIYGASALAIDIGGSFIHPKSELVVSILFKNLGFTLADYTSSSRARLPTDLQVGLTFKPKKMPFRWTLTGHHLIHFNRFAYFYENSSMDKKKTALADRIFRHVSLGLEVIFSPHVQLRAGYNHAIRSALRLPEKSGLAGISLGAMVRIQAFELAYTFTNYHASGGRSYFTLTTSLNRIFKKKTII